MGEHFNKRSEVIHSTGDLHGFAEMLQTDRLLEEIRPIQSAVSCKNHDWKEMI